MMEKIFVSFLKNEERVKNKLWVWDFYEMKVDEVVG